MKDYKMIIGIDPGSNGSIVYMKMKDGETPELPVSVKMPKDFKDINAYLKEITEGFDRSICFIEKVGMNPSDMVGGKAFGIQKLLRNFEFLKAALIENNVGFIQVHPQTWQSQLKLKLPRIEAKKESKTERKNRYKRIAQQYFPATEIRLWNSDALLLVYFGHMKLTTDEQYIRENCPEIDFDILF